MADKVSGKATQSRICASVSFLWKGVFFPGLSDGSVWLWTGVLEQPAF